MVVDTLKEPDVQDMIHPQELPILVCEVVVHIWDFAEKCHHKVDINGRIFCEKSSTSTCL